MSASLCRWPCQSTVGLLLGLGAAWAGGLCELGISCRVRVLSRCLVPREGTVSPGTAPGAAAGPALPLSAFLRPLSPHCPLLPAGIFIALLLRFDIR